LQKVAQSCAMMIRKVSKAPPAKAQKNIGETTTSPARLFTPEELGGLISFHPESIRRCIRAGRIHALKFGAGWRIPAVEVERITTRGLASV
jgi:hypothetical protein